MHAAIFSTCCRDALHFFFVTLYCGWWEGGGGTFIVQARLSWLLGAKKGHSLPDAVHVSRQIYGNTLIHPIPVPQAPFLYSPVPRSLSLPRSRSTNPLATAGSQPYVTIATADV